MLRFVLSMKKESWSLATAMDTKFNHTLNLLLYYRPLIAVSSNKLSFPLRNYKFDIRITKWVVRIKKSVYKRILYCFTYWNIYNEFLIVNGMTNHFYIFGTAVLTFLGKFHICLFGISHFVSSLSSVSWLKVISVSGANVRARSKRINFFVCCQHHKNLTT